MKINWTSVAKRDTELRAAVDGASEALARHRYENTIGAGVKVSEYAKNVGVHQTQVRNYAKAWELKLADSKLKISDALVKASTSEEQCGRVAPPSPSPLRSDMTVSAVVEQFDQKQAAIQGASEALREILRHDPGPWSARALQEKALASGNFSPVAVRTALLYLQDNGELRASAGFTLSATPA